MQVKRIKLCIRLDCQFQRCSIVCKYFKRQSLIPMCLMYEEFSNQVHTLKKTQRIKVHLEETLMFIYGKIKLLEQ